MWLIGFGRAISDGAYQAGVYDVAVVSERQGKGVGKTILRALLGKIGRCGVILYASPGKEKFYEELGFSLMKTGMASFLNPEKCGLADLFRFSRKSHVASLRNSQSPKTHEL